MDKIILKGLLFYAYHGLKEEEKKLGQRFIVDLELYLDLSAAGKSDNLNETIDYGAVYRVVAKIVAGDKKYNLIESLAEDIAVNLFKHFLFLEELVVSVKKPEAPIAAPLDYVAVEIRRRRG